MKDIAIIVQKLNGGGAERAAANLSIALSKRYHVHLVVFDGRDIKYPYAGDLHDIKMPPNESGVGKLINVIKRVNAVRKIKKDCNIIASISLMDGANLVNVLSRVNDKVFPSIRIQMSKAPKRMKKGKLKASEYRRLHFIENKATKIVAVAKGVEEDLVKNCGVARSKVTTIYNMCDGNVILENAIKHEDEASTMSELSITTMGRLDNQKGQWHLIRAFADVLKTIPDAHLYILGDGPLEKELKQLTSDLRILDNVHFLGFIEAPHAYIRRSRVFVLPSLYEGMINTILEAMNCGTPVIATDCESGSREILAPGTGLSRKLDAVEYAEYGILTTVGDEGHFNATDELTEDERQLTEGILSVLKTRAIYSKYNQLSLKRSSHFSFYCIGTEWFNLIEGK